MEDLPNGLLLPRYDVAVIGAGLAGLQAAQALRIQAPGLKVVVLEASSRIGGRVKSVEGIAPWPVEVGPEFLHGKNASSIKRLVDAMGCQQREYPFPDRYYIGKEARLLSGEESHPAIDFCDSVFANMAEEDDTQPDTSMAAFLRSKGASDTVVQLGEAIYANDFGCSLEDLGVRECIEEARQWVYGDTYFVCDRPLHRVAEFLAQGLDVRTGWPVKRVEYSPRGLSRLTSSRGGVVVVERVVVTVPVKVLSEGDVEFVPPLPPRKLAAAKAIGMSNALKVICAFSQRFWPPDLFDVVCTDSFLPEIWFTAYPPAVAPPREPPTALGWHPPRKENAPPHDRPPPLGAVVAVGFVAGRLADDIARLPRDEVLSRMLAQLDAIFGTPPHPETPPLPRHDPSNFANKVNLDPKHNPASCAFTGGHIENWADEPFIRGAYSYPTLGAHGARGVLAEPLLGRVFFAGEATHPGVNPCMQAALDTGVRVAAEVQAAALSSRL